MDISSTWFRLVPSFPRFRKRNSQTCLPTAIFCLSSLLIAAVVANPSLLIVPSFVGRMSWVISIAYELFLAVDKCNFGFVHSEGFASFVFVEYTNYGSRLEVVAISYDGTKEYEAAV